MRPQPPDGAGTGLLAALAGGATSRRPLTVASTFPSAAGAGTAMARTRSAAKAVDEPEREDTGMVLPPVPSQDDQSNDPAVRAGGIDCGLLLRLAA